MPSGLVTVTTINNGYTLSFYDNTQVGGLQNGMYTLNQGATAFVTWTVENPAGDQNSVRVTEDRGGLQRVHLYTYVSAVNTWRLDRPDGSYSTSQKTTDANGYTKTYELRDSGGALISKLQKVYSNVASINDALIHQEIEGDGAMTRTTTYDYYPDDASPSAVHLRRIDYPDGGWVYYEYDYLGRRQYDYSPYNNSAAPAANNPPDPASLGCKMTEYVYGGSGPDADLPSEVVRYLPAYDEGTHQWSLFEVARTSTYRTYALNGRLAQVDSTQYAYPGTLATTTKYITDLEDDSAGMVQSVAHTDGRISYFQYLPADGSGAVVTIEETGEPDGTGGIANGERIETQLDKLGRTLYRKILPIQSGAVGPLLSHISYQYSTSSEDYSMTDVLANATTSYTYDCCGLASVTDPEGIVTQLDTDQLHRRVAAQTLRGAGGLKVTNVLNAAGSVLVRKRIGAGDLPAAAVTTEQFAYDVLGRVIRTTNALGGITTNLYLSNSWGGRREVTLYPYGGTRTNDYYLDGNLAKVTGTEVSPVQYERGIAVDGGCWRSFVTETKLDASWSATAEWTKSYEDGMDRTYKVVYADATPEDESDNPYRQYFYNDLGQLWKERDPDDVITFYVYSGSGEREYVIKALSDQTRAESSYLDLISDLPNIKGRTDRITRTVRTAVGSPDRTQLETFVWVDNSSTSKLTSRAESWADGRHSRQTVWRETGNDSTKGVTESVTTVNAATHERTVTVTMPDNTQTVSVYTNGLLQSVTKLDNSSPTRLQVTQTLYGYDKYERRCTASDARTGVRALGYNHLDLVTTETAPPSGLAEPQQVTSTSYDCLGRATNVVQPDGTALNREYFPNGLLKKEWGSRSYPVEHIYDIQGRLRTNKTWQTFSSGGGAAITRWNYDAARGWLNSKDYPDASTGYPPVSEGTSGTAYTYTPGGRLKTRTWLRGVTTTYTYGFDDGTAGNEHADLVKVEYSNDPAGTPLLAYAYDRRGRRITITQALTAVSALSYDDANESLGESYTGGTLGGLSVSVGYDNNLRRNSLAIGGATGYSASYGYDTAGRLQTVTLGSSTATYAYLANSSLVEQITFAESGTNRMTTTKQFDKLNRLARVASVPLAGATVVFDYAYNTANQRVRTTQSDGSYWVYTYDALGQVTSGRRFWQDGTPVAGQQFDYAFDDIGNRKSTGVGGDSTGGGMRSAAYTADRLNRYSQRTVPAYTDVLGIANPTASVTVNGNTANRKGEYFHYALSTPNSSTPWFNTVTVASTFPPGQNSSGSVFVPKSPEVYGYDVDGNLTSDGRWNYTWDAENRLIKVESLATAPSGSKRRLEFAYDYMGRRIWEKITNLDTSTVTTELRFLYDGWNLIASVNASQATLISKYVWGLDLSGSLQGAGGVGGLLMVNDGVNGNHFTCYDGNGNVAALVKASDGSIQARYEYGPFGEVLRKSGPVSGTNPFRFSTKYQDDETDLLYYGYRYYSVSMGRWLSVDPVAESGGLNLLAVCKNNTINLMDPRGLKDKAVNHDCIQHGKVPTTDSGWKVKKSIPDGNISGGGSAGAREADGIIIIYVRELTQEYNCDCCIFQVPPPGKPKNITTRRWKAQITVTLGSLTPTITWTGFSNPWPPVNIGDAVTDIILDKLAPPVPWGDANEQIVKNLERQNLPDASDPGNVVPGTDTGIPQRRCTHKTPPEGKK
jgi:RHS repeat-associated protein